MIVELDGGLRTILVVGATGAQGGSVARHLLARGFAVRALTRDPVSEPAARLRAVGAEVVGGDLSDRPSLRAALAGCWGAFGITARASGVAREFEHGRNLIHAVAGAEIEHFVLSSLPSARRLSAGELTVARMDAVAELEEYSRRLGLLATYVHVAPYFESFLAPGVLRPCPGGARDGSGRLAFAGLAEDRPVAAVSVEDVGGVVASIFERPGPYAGRTLAVAGDERPLGGYADALALALARPVSCQPVSDEAFVEILSAAGCSHPHEAAGALALTRFLPSRRPEIEECRSLYPRLQDFSAWAARNGSQLEVALAA